MSVLQKIKLWCSDMELKVQSNTFFDEPCTIPNTTQRTDNIKQMKERAGKKKNAKCTGMVFFLMAINQQTLWFIVTCLQCFCEIWNSQNSHNKVIWPDVLSQPYPQDNWYKLLVSSAFSFTENTSLNIQVLAN